MKDSCQRFKEMVSEYVEGELDHQNQSLMEQHLRDCLVCKSKISQLKRLIKNLKDLPRIKVSHDFETILRARISMESSLARRRRGQLFPVSQFPLPAYAFAGIVLIVALFTVLALNKSNRVALPQSDINNEWIQGGIQKVDPVTNERYIYIIETQPVANIKSQTNAESDQQIDKSAISDSSQVFKDSKLWHETAQALESKIY
jgi:hypothetical protein